MLVLGCRKKEWFVIDTGVGLVRVKATSAAGPVRLVFDAPKEMRIWREEIDSDDTDQHTT